MAEKLAVICVIQLFMLLVVSIKDANINNELKEIRMELKKQNKMIKLRTPNKGENIFSSPFYNPSSAREFYRDNRRDIAS